MFDAGQAIGDLILERCQLEDAFFISSLLEAPLDSLRSRGFPVDRLIKEEEKDYTPHESVVIAQSSPTQQVIADKGVDGGATVAQGNVSKGVNNGGIDHAIDKGESDMNDDSEGSKVDILKNMFPAVDKSMLQALLGDNPSMDDVVSLANQLATGVVPKADDETVSTRADEDTESTATAEPKKKSWKKRLSKPFGEKKGSSFGGMQMPTMSVAPPTNRATEHRQPVSPAADASTQSQLEKSLARSVSSANTVQQSGFESPETKLTSIPEDLDRGDAW
jgi:hypothetical protein